MKVDIPFAFQTVNGTRAAGTYTLRYQDVRNDSKVLSLRDDKSGHSEFLIGMRSGVKKGNPAVVFRCGAAGCVLSAVQTAEGTVAYNAKLAPRNKETAEVIVPLRARDAD